MNKQTNKKTKNNQPNKKLSIKTKTKQKKPTPKKSKTKQEEKKKALCGFFLLQRQLCRDTVTDRHIREQERVKTNREKLTFCSSEEIKRGYFSLLPSQASPWTAGPCDLKYLPPSQHPTESHAGKCQGVLSYCNDCLLPFDQPKRDGRWSPPSLGTVTKAPNIVI